MKTATIEELYSSQSEVMRWVEAGETVAIRRNNILIARIVPAPARILPKPFTSSNRPKSAALTRDKSQMKCLTAEESSALIKNAGGKW